MSIIKDLFLAVFSRNPYERTILRMGYSSDGNTYIKESYEGRTTIWLDSDGVRIKVYAHVYGESDFLPAEKLNVKNLKSFIRSNEL